MRIIYMKQEKRWGSNARLCRQPRPAQKEIEINRMKRLRGEYPIIMCQMAGRRYDEGDYACAFEYYTNASGLGDVEANHRLGLLYRDGEGREG